MTNGRAPLTANDPFIKLCCYMTVQELAVDRSRLVEVTTLAQKLIKQGHGGAHIIQEHQDNLKAKLVCGDQREESCIVQLVD